MKSFSNAAFAFYAPKLYHYYCETLQKLYDHHPNLGPPFYGSIWPSESGSGDAACLSALHNDHNNLAFGWCAIQPVGDFDNTTGGHLILQQFGIVAEFPAGTACLLPSAVIKHGNTPLLQAEQTRKSLVSYAAGGLFRWVEYGFRTWKQFAAAEPVRSKQVWAQRRRERPKFALSLFSKVEELVHDHRHVFGL
ncbi:hypothetical protein PsYK624_146140 [Phanerochaete sordida]|uniref:Uncharacterized protein n=1 Tax=Phanerochaete sordida TaxID=48140 RepID=A0A9P3GRY4_9APHY|nr:hypothetical protein PsYK624_146140 [Phanerochaete sordida]